MEIGKARHQVSWWADEEDRRMIEEAMTLTGLHQKTAMLREAVRRLVAQERKKMSR